MSLRIGVSMMIAGLSAPMWALIAPFFGVTDEGLTEFILTMGAIGEVMFWSGVALAGRKSWRLIKAEGWRKTPGILVRVMARGESAMPNARRSYEPVPNFVSVAPPRAELSESQVRFMSVPPPRGASTIS